MDPKVAKLYGNKVRVRACGICFKGDHLLLVNHAGITQSNFWAPPGGGIEFGQSIQDCLRKEFVEETGLTVQPETFRFGCEYISEPIHAIELFYSVTIISGRLKTGSDPELQIIRDVRFLSMDEISNIPTEALHGIFRTVSSPADLKDLKGFFRI